MPRIDVNAVRSHVQRLIPEGDYEIKFDKVEEKEAQTGRAWFQFTCKFEDTIPSGIEIDRESFVDPMKDKKTLTKGLFFPMNNDKPGTIDFFMSEIKKILNCSNCVPVSDDGLEPSDFINLYCGVKVKHKPINEDDPTGDKRAEIVAFVPLP